MSSAVKPSTAETSAVETTTTTAAAASPCYWTEREEGDANQ
jgi:hypothetical protein